MGGSDDDKLIPSVFIGWSSGQDILEKYTHNIGMYIKRMPQIYRISSYFILNSGWLFAARWQSLRAQSYTTLKADLRQDINGGFAFSRCRNGIFP